MSSPPEQDSSGGGRPVETAASMTANRLRRRYAAERRFRIYGVAATGFALVALLLLVVTVSFEALFAFVQSEIELEVELDESEIDPAGGRQPEVLVAANYDALIRRAVRELFPEVTGRREKRELYSLLSVGASYQVQDVVMADPDSIGTRQRFWLPLSDDADLYFKGRVSAEGREEDRKLSNRQVAWLDALAEKGLVERRFNRRFFTSGDSREPELAGVSGAIRGTFLTLLVTLVLSFPIGVSAAIYLEEFAPRNRFTDVIEVNINNLAAVPSIIFGLLGLAVFLNLMGLPRSAPLVGGMVLALMTLPTIIIASRAALAAVPPSIREAALGVGASPTQAVLHHVLPVAIPGILTGTIIGMARALGETAPLLMIGMVAFIVDLPTGLTDASTVLPVQVYLWSEAPERAFVEKTSAAIMVLLGFLVLMNGSAVWLRRHFERRNDTRA